VGFALGDDNTTGDMSPVIKEGVDLQGALGLAKPGPPKHRQTQIHRGGIQGVELMLEAEFVARRFMLTSLIHQAEQLLKNPIGAPLVGLCHGGAGKLGDAQVNELP